MGDETGGKWVELGKVNCILFLSTRVTPGGRIEDEGDFSDFYNLPNNVDPAHRQFLQEIQDEVSLD